MHVFPNNAVGVAKCANAHLLRHGLPVVQSCVQNNGVVCTFAMELESSKVVDDQVSLRGLVELKLKDWRSALGHPEIGDLINGLGRHVASLVLAYEKLVGRNADH